MTTWPNGGGLDLAPLDYYRVRFVAPDEDGPVSVGDEGVVVDHVLSESGEKGCMVEVGPWGPFGEPRAVVAVNAAKLEKLSGAVEEDEARRIALRQLTREAEDMGLYD